MYDAQVFHPTKHQSLSSNDQNLTAGVPLLPLAKWLSPISVLHYYHNILAPFLHDSELKHDMTRLRKFSFVIFGIFMPLDPQPLPTTTLIGVVQQASFSLLGRQQRCSHAHTIADLVFRS